MAFGFAKTARLLTPADFKYVFDGATLKISSKEILILARANIGPGSGPRLGLVIAKKHVRLAHQRNRVKRIARDSFRHQQQLAGLDIIVLARGGIAQLDNPTLHKQFEQLWQQLRRKAIKLRDAKSC
jgi:ribonuclease P protein component